MSFGKSRSRVDSTQSACFQDEGDGYCEMFFEVQAKNEGSSLRITQPK